ncbi:hypothetical protein [Nostoc sp. 'Lobaria pulmonaria (5183) cyanobiont']|uniref:hypothetical protein n=1 Tax=Nostoc sp. 'Lobaria pulmonaria (5183) cyanobiont' TaxID=1618022 RepID=UPI00131A43FD|nr:hypothetical protein [Nostoc sp. 'Lobaria pulmonaria (5183) cyanobiont']
MNSAVIMGYVARNPSLFSVLDAFTYNVSLLQADSRVKDRDLPDVNSTLIHINSKILPRYAIANGVV